jgi:hypothetical protein
MNRQLEETLERAAHVALHSHAGKEAVKNVGTAVLAVATPLLATPAAPVVVGAFVVAGVYVGGKKLAAWLNW